MQIRFLGTGGAFEPHKGTSAAIVHCNGKNILIDCGYTTFQTLKEKNLAKEVDYVLITHLHGDHIGGLPTYLAYAEIMCGKKVQIIYPTELFRQAIESLLTLTFEIKRAHFVPLSQVEGIGFLDTTGQHVAEMTSYAYHFIEGKELLYYSGDLGVIETTEAFLQTRTENTIRVFHDIGFKENPVHVYYKKAQEKLINYEVYGYHCDGANKPADCTLPLVEERSEFLY